MPTPAPLDFYGYDKCSSCRNARKWLDQHKLPHRFIDITEHPPALALLKKLLAAGHPLPKLFNTSGILYREMDIKSRLPAMTPDQALALLAQHGKLCKRPIVTDGRRFTVGFDAERFAEVWT